ncbi:hypothetical protein TNCV_3923201 [Trichonephila clavipes]|nr:hypothetical protein TNCV_3923201 [Trichonephila clavipes]
MGKNFKRDGNLGISNWQVFVTEDTVDHLRDSFCRSPDKYIRQASNELQIHLSTVHIVHKLLNLRAYNLQLLHQLKPNEITAQVWREGIQLLGLQGPEIGLH